MTATFEIEETGRTIMFKGLPEGAKHLDILGLAPINLSITYFTQHQAHHYPLPKGNWTLLGIYPGLEDGKLEGVMPKVGLNMYRNYNISLYSERGFPTALESLSSLMQHLKLYTSNPYKEDWDELCAWGHGGFAKDGKTEYELFTEAQSRTYPLWAVLVK